MDYITNIIICSGIFVAGCILYCLYQKCCNDDEFECCNNDCSDSCDFCFFICCVLFCNCKKNQIHASNTFRQTRPTIQQTPPKVVEMTKIIPKSSAPTCSICLEPLNNDNVQCCSCGHCFHAKCIQKWLKNHDTCPNCRQSCENLLQKSLFQ